MIFTITSFTKKETTLLKGIAIILIVFHNFFRWVHPITGENEFYFNPYYSLNSIDIVLNNWLQIFNVFFNFFGHFGVQIFIFLSAYGLAVSYGEREIKWTKFVWSRFKKLYPIFILGAIIYILFYVFRNGILPPNEVFYDILLQLSLVANFIPGKAMVITGPWWFFSLIFQFYLVFPLIMLGYKKFKTRFLVVIGLLSLIVLYIFNPFFISLQLNLLQTFIGHLPEFLLGVAFAFRKEIKLNWWIVSLSLALFVISCFIEHFWILGFISFTVFFIWLHKNIYTAKIAAKPFTLLFFIGNISVYIFVIHGFLRERFLGLGNSMNDPIMGILGSLIFFAFVLIVSYGMQKTDESIKLYFSKPNLKRFAQLALLPMIIIFGSMYYVIAYNKYIAFQLSLQEKKLFSSAEVLSNDNSYIADEINSDVSFGKSWIRTDKDFKTGNYSFYTDSSSQFAPSVVLKEPTPCQKITVSVWRKSYDSEIGVLVISIPETGFYASTNTPIKSENGWDLLELKTEIPCQITNQEVKVYCWNQAKLPVFFDDITVIYY